MTHETILLIDDEELVRTAIETSLLSEDYKVIPAASGGAAIEALERFGESIDLLLMDFGLPDMSGLDLLSFMRAQNIEIPIVICSGRIVDEDLLPIRPLTTLLKPFTIDQLLDVLNSAFGIDPD